MSPHSALLPWWSRWPRGSLGPSGDGLGVKALPAPRYPWAKPGLAERGAGWGAGRALEPPGRPSAGQGPGQMVKGSRVTSPKPFPGATTAAAPALPRCSHWALEQERGSSGTEAPKTLNVHFSLSLSWDHTQPPSRRAKWDIVTPVTILPVWEPSPQSPSLGTQMSSPKAGLAQGHTDAAGHSLSVQETLWEQPWVQSGHPRMKTSPVSRERPAEAMCK